MTSAQSWSWLSADVFHADLQMVIPRYIQNISACPSCEALSWLGTIYMQKSKTKYACSPSKIVAVWIDRFCVRYYWWRRLHQCPQCEMSVMACQTTDNPKFNSLFSLTFKKSLTLFDVYPSVSGGLPYEGPVCGKFPCHTIMFFSHVDIMWWQEY